MPLLAPDRAPLLYLPDDTLGGMVRTTPGTHLENVNCYWHGGLLLPKDCQLSFAYQRGGMVQGQVLSKAALATPGTQIETVN